MTDPIPESGIPEVMAEEPAAPQSLPSPTFTEKVSGSSTSGSEMDALADKVAARLKPDFEKIAQSTKDKRFAKLEKAMGVSELAELEEMGVPISNEVKLEYRLRQLEHGQVPQTSGGSGVEQDSASVSQVIQEAGLDANKPEVLNLLRGQYRNLDHFAKEAFALKLRLAAKQPPSVSSAPVISGDTPSSTEKSEDQLMKEYQAEVKGVRGNVLAVSNVQAKYRKQGLKL